MRIDFGGLQCGLGFHFEPARTCMSKFCSGWLGTRASSAAVSKASSIGVVVVPLDFLLSYRRTSSSHFSSRSEIPSSLHRSGTKMCRKSALRSPPLKGPQRRTNRLDLMVALQEQIEAFSFCRRQKCKMNLFALLLNFFNWFCTNRTKLSIKCFVRCGPIVEPYAAIRNPEVLLSHSLNLADSTQKSHVQGRNLTACSRRGPAPARTQRAAHSVNGSRKRFTAHDTVVFSSVFETSLFTTNYLICPNVPCLKVFRKFFNVFYF